VCVCVMVMACYAGGCEQIEGRQVCVCVCVMVMAWYAGGCEQIEGRRVCVCVCVCDGDGLLCRWL